MVKFLLIRHAQTDTAGIKLTGRAPQIHLNEKGKRQAEALAEKLMNIRIDAICSSPLERAVETAKPIAKSHYLDLIIMDDFLEVDFGKWTGMNISDLKDDHDFQKFNNFRSMARIPEGETIQEAQQRIVNGMKRLYQKFQDKTVAIVSHADIIKAAIVFFAGIPIDMMQRLEISPASVSILDMYDETVRIVSVNSFTDTP